MRDYSRFQPQPVIGLDEAGRGALAGPVFAGAVILNFPDTFSDSKALSPKKRESLFKKIKTCHIFSIGMASVQEIDTLNIHQASLLAMERAVKKLKMETGHLLIDGKFPIKNLNLKQTPIVKGDTKYAPIMAASIVAKTQRDALLREYGKQYPIYKFEEHKGYATKKHKITIREYGACPLHRKTFAGVKEFLQ